MGMFVIHAVESDLVHSCVHHFVWLCPRIN